MPRSSQRASLGGRIASIASFPEFPDDDDEVVGDVQQAPLNRSRASSNTRASIFSAGVVELDDKDNSVSVITSVWSTMMGSTVLVMPAMFRDAGMIASVISLVFMCFLCAYTAVTITRLGRLHGMSTKEVVGTLPPAPRIFTYISAIAILVGASMLFHVYIVECIMALAGLSINKDAEYRVLCAIGTGFLVFVMIIPRSIKILFVASSYGIVIIGFCLLFIMIKSILQFARNDCSPKLESDYGTNYGGFGPVASLMSALTISFFSHSFVLQLVSQSTRMSKVPRNVFISYMCAGVSYCVPAAVATMAFSNCKTFSDDFVGMFSDPFADAARFAIILLVLIVYPIVIAIARTQFIEAVWNQNAEDAKRGTHIGLGGVMIAIVTIVPCVNAGPTTVAALLGVLGTYWALILPCALYLHTRWKSQSLTKPLIIGHTIVMVFAVVLIIITITSVAGIISSAAPLPPTAVAPLLPHVPAANHTNHSVIPPPTPNHTLGGTDTSLVIAAPGIQIEEP
jgi:hypothetical protein